MGIKKMVSDSMPAGIALSALWLFICALSGQGEKVFFLAFAALFAPAAGKYFLAGYRAEQRKRKIEDEIPDLLLLASSLPGNASLAKIIDFMCQNDGPLSQEFRTARAEMRAGMPTEQALERICARNGSLALTRAIRMIIAALNSGADMARAFRETAEDFMRTNSILRERAAAGAMQKYTLLLCGLLVPFILGKLGSMVEGFSLSELSGIGIGAGENLRLEIAAACSLANILYIAEFALIASAFIAFQEGKQGKFVLYAAGMLPASLLIYFLSRGGA